MSVVGMYMSDSAYNVHAWNVNRQKFIHDTKYLIKNFASKNYSIGMEVSVIALLEHW